MKNLIKYFLVIFILINFNKIAFSDTIYFIDYSKVLNLSKAGADAQEKLKNKFKSESEMFKKQEEDLKKIEQDLISQKKVLSSSEYQSKVESLRAKVSEFQKKQQESLQNIARSRAQAKQKLQNSINPIIKNYMEQNDIKVVLDKQSVVLGDTNQEITDKVIEILNKEIKSIKID